MKRGFCAHCGTPLTYEYEGGTEVAIGALDEPAKAAPVKKARPNEHPEINKPKPKPRMLKGEKQALQDMQELARKDDLSDMYGNRVKPGEVKSMVEQKRILKQGKPSRG